MYSELDRLQIEEDELITAISDSKEESFQLINWKLMNGKRAELLEAELSKYKDVVDVDGILKEIEEKKAEISKLKEKNENTELVSATRKLNTLRSQILDSRYSTPRVSSELSRRRKLYDENQRLRTWNSVLRSRLKSAQRKL